MAKCTVPPISRAEIGFAARFYADKRNSCTYRNLMQMFGSTKRRAYTLLYSAVTKHIVDDSVVNDMEEKARYNTHAAEWRSTVNYNNLRWKRDMYLRNFPTSQALQVIQMYADSEENQKEFREREGISRELFNTIMLQYLVTDAVSEETFQKIMRKGIRDNYSEKAKNIWLTISEKRKSNLGQG